MNQDLLTASLLLMNAAMLLLVLLYFRAARYIAMLLECIHDTTHQTQAKLKKFARDTDYDFRALKTRERNQEKAHQAATAKARREVKH